MAQMAQYMPTMGVYQSAFLEFQMQRNAEQMCFHDKNVAIMAYFGKEFTPCLFAKMLTPMRIALGMSTHFRLGSCKDCKVGQLNGDTMNIIFNELVRGIVTSPREYKHMLC